MLDRLSLVPRQHTPVWLNAVSTAGGIGLGLLLAVLVLLAGGVDIGGIVNEFILYSFTSSRGLAQTLTKGTALLLVGLACAVALKLRFWNIGVDGQVWLGAIAAAGIATHDVGPPDIRLWIMGLSAVVAGAIWIGVPVLLRLKLQVNEVISTLMLSYVAFLLAQHFLYGSWRDPSTSFPVTANFDAATEQLARIGFGHVHSGIWLALAAAVLVGYLMLISRFGFYLTAVGLNPRGARAAGLPVTLVIVFATLISGGLCGLAGFTIIAGQEYRLTQFIAHGYTFSVILIAFLARFNPIAVIPVAFIVAGLFTAGDTLKTFYQLPLALILVVESLILLAVVAVDFFARYRITFSHADLTARQKHSAGRYSPSAAGDTS
ncbi:MAG: ABC transporter permease [Gammaproteobacteria bacterium]